MNWSSNKCNLVECKTDCNCCTNASSDVTTTGCCRCFFKNTLLVKVRIIYMHNTAPLGSVSALHNSSYHCCDTRPTLWFPALTHRLGCISPIFSLKSPIGSPPSTSRLTLTGLNCCSALWNPAFNENCQSVWAPASPLLPILMFELIWGNQLLLLIQISCLQNLLIQNSCLSSLDCCSSDVTDQLEQQQGSSKFKQELTLRYILHSIRMCCCSS